MRDAFAITAYPSIKTTRGGKTIIVKTIIIFFFSFSTAPEIKTFGDPTTAVRAYRNVTVTVYDRGLGDFSKSLSATSVVVDYDGKKKKKKTLLFYYDRT